MGTQLLGDCSSPRIARTGKYSTGRYLLVRFTQPEDIFRWMGGISEKIGGGEKSNTPFFMESGFLLIKLKCIRIG
jgi:hypothetical protein